MNEKVLAHWEKNKKVYDTRHDSLLLMSGFRPKTEYPECVKCKVTKDGFYYYRHF